MNQADFLQALQIAQSRVRGGIGTLSEKSVHAVLKAAYEPHTENHELSVGGYVADIVGQNGIIEIQTRELWRLKEKLRAFLDVCEVTVVYPVSVTEWICRTDPDTGEMIRRKSPRHGQAADILPQLYGLREFLKNPGFHLRVVLLETERYDIGKPREKRRKLDRVPLDFLGEIELDHTSDYEQLLFKELPEEFTVQEYSRAAGCRLGDARMALSVLCALGLAEQAGKSGRKNLYRFLSPSKNN